MSTRTRAQWFFETPVLPEAITDPYDPPSHPPLQPIDVPQRQRQPPSRNAVGMLEWVARNIAETLSGARAPAQLEQWLAPAICRRLRIAARNGGWGDPAQTRVSGITEQNHAIDGVAHLSRMGRTVAAAVHLEADRGRWRCTGFDLLLPGG